MQLVHELTYTLTPLLKLKAEIPSLDAILSLLIFEDVCSSN